MEVNELEQAKKKADELIKYSTKTDKLRYFIRKLHDDRYLSLAGLHQSEMWSDSRETFALVGQEIIDLLERKLEERVKYLESIKADDLIVEDEQ